MKKSIISESQIVAAIKAQELGKKVADICRELGVHKATFYNWNKNNQELRRLKELEEEIADLACRVASLPKSMYYYQKLKDDSQTIAKLQELALAYPTEGQDLYYGRIRT